MVPFFSGHDVYNSAINTSQRLNRLILEQEERLREDEHKSKDKRPAVGSCALGR